MSALAMVSLSSPQIGLAALALAIAAVGIAIIRRIDIPIMSAMLLAAGVISVAAAAGGPVWHRSEPGTIAVMVDLSPSTRGARFRDADFLRRRVRELIGDSRREFIAFADHNVPIDPLGPMEEMPADQTRFSPAAADAIVLFSDARFDLPKSSPPVYVAVDENLENASDASVQRLELRGRTLAATIANSGPPRKASLEGTTGSTTVGIDPGNLVITRPIAGGATQAAVKLNAADLWPENDSLSLRVAAAPASEQWWIGENSPGGYWRTFPPDPLPEISQEYLAPAVIVVDNQPADRFTPSQMDCLMQYVRDLGGSLLIVGGDRAFAAGGYAGTALEQLTPLSSSPPDPTTRWILLVDGSGSMGQDAGDGISRWQAAVQAVVHLLPSLPPADPVQIGQFSDVVRWWCEHTTAAEAARTTLPPADAFPHGPTNLESVLFQIAHDAGGTLPTELLLVS
ncbi:MAG: VWA domain-containing protein, partial [Tepidisphaeraceae bacterium]